MRGTLPSSADPPLPQSYWVSVGDFAAGEYPGDHSPHEAAKRVRRLLAAGIDHFIDLTHRADRMKPYAAIAETEAEKLGHNVVIERHPIVDVSIPDRPSQMSAILDAIDTALEADKTVYLHCWGGVGRTGTVVGCWLVRHGKTGEEALGQIAHWWRRVPKSRYHPHSPQTLQQYDYVRGWTEPSASTNRA